MGEDAEPDDADENPEQCVGRNRQPDGGDAVSDRNSDREDGEVGTAEQRARSRWPG